MDHHAARSPRSLRRPDIRTLSLCAGIGGLDLGVRMACGRARTICYVEREAYCIEVLARRMEEGKLDSAPCWTDLKSFDGRSWRGSVDAVIGGYPCQPFALVGRRKGADDPRHLWPHVARVVGECGPGICFFENVPGHVSLGLRDVVGDLEGMGFRVEAGLFSAEEAGASHERQRLYLMAHAARGLGLLQDEPAAAGVDPQAHGGTRPDADGEPGGRRQPAARGAFARLPGPDDVAGWREHLRDGGTIPFVHGATDGASRRVDRLRAVGNGVCPQAAALAWRTLAARALAANAAATAPASDVA